MFDKTTQRARTLRKRTTDAERLFWYFLRSRRLRRYKFRRQHKMGRYIVDFVCLQANLIIELDGGQHAAQRTYDQKRTRYLEAVGFTVLRYWNDEVLLMPEVVLEDVLAHMGAHPSPRKHP